MKRWLSTLTANPADRVLLGLVAGFLVWIVVITVIILVKQRTGELVRVHS